MKSTGIGLLIGVMALAFLVAIEPLAQAQRPGDRGRRDRFGGNQDLLRDPAVLKELELVDDQREKIENLRNDSRSERREVFSSLRDQLEGLSREERREKFRETFTDLRKKFDSQINEVLLPHQRDRLRQITLQRNMQRRGTSASLASDQLSKAIGLTDEQKKRLEKVQQEVEKDTREKINKIRQQAREKVLAVLTPDQRQKLQQLLGEKFDPPPRERGPRRRPGQ